MQVLASLILYPWSEPIDTKFSLWLISFISWEEVVACKFLLFPNFELQVAILTFNKSTTPMTDLPQRPWLPDHHTRDLLMVTTMILLSATKGTITNHDHDLPNGHAYDRLYMPVMVYLTAIERDSQKS